MSMKKYFLLINFFCVNIFLNQNVCCCDSCLDKFLLKIVNVFWNKNKIISSDDLIDRDFENSSDFEEDFCVDKFESFSDNSPDNSKDASKFLCYEIAEFTNLLNNCLDLDNNLNDDIDIVSFEKFEKKVFSIYFHKPNLDRYLDFLNQKIDNMDFFYKKYHRYKGARERILIVSSVMKKSFEKLKFKK